MTHTERRPEPRAPGVERSAWGRLVEAQTAVDFVGRRKIGLIISAVLLVISVASLFTRELNLGIDFEGGVSWDVPADNGFSSEDAEAVLTDNGLEVEGARIQERRSESGEFVKVQVGDQPAEVGEQLRAAFAEAADVPIDDVNVNLVSSTWGEQITEKAIRALVIFLALVALFIAIRFEWRMALAAILAMIHDVLISVGIYSVLQWVVTPATVIAFLTILGYSLYDTIVVFDRIRENEAKVGVKRPPYADVVNVSMNQVLMRSLNTSMAAIVPVLSLLLIGSGLLGQATLSEFALALLIGMITGAYSSIFIAVPLVYSLKQRDPKWANTSGDAERAVGEELREMVIAGGSITRRSGRVRGSAVAPESTTGDAGGTPRQAAAAVSTDPTKVLTHPPRPRKKTRR
jgi:preprotein translocase subunit SecF